MPEVCGVCSGTGFRIVTRDGDRYAQDCECRIAKRAEQRLVAARIPRRHEHCTLENFEDALRVGEDLVEPKYMATRFVLNYRVDAQGRGLLFTGPAGVGKTHLAVGMLKALVVDHGVKGLFCDYRDLLKQIQNSYNSQAQTTEMQLLQPLFDAEVLVLDELGATRPSGWVWDTVALIINQRYLDKQTTIFTTNYPNEPAAGEVPVKEGRATPFKRLDTLGDQIGERMRSRVSEMCVTIPIDAKDFRKTAGKAAFTPWAGEFSEDVQW